MVTLTRKLTPAIRRLRLDDIRLLGLFCGILGMVCASIAPINAWEVDLGLPWLFRLRGHRPPPSEVVLISLDRRSAGSLGLDPHRLYRWPRQLHARLLNRLTEANAGVVVFDIHFHEPRGAEEDAALAGALSRAANVVLFEYLRKTGDEHFMLEERLGPLPRFAESALGTAPFTLPKGQHVHQFWLFKEGAGDAPSLPVVALHGLLQRALRATGTESPFPTNLKAHQLATLLRADDWPGIQEPSPIGLSDHDQTLFDAVAALHRGPGSRYLDFYGPPTSFRIIPYRQALTDPGDLDGRAVFVGYLEQPFETSQIDSFQTPFPGRDGVAASGMEIAATAFANLLEQRFPTQLPAGLSLVLLLLWGSVTILLYRLPAPRALPGALLLGVLYLGLATLLFRGWALWLPVATPLLIQLPVALLGALLLRYVERQRLQQHLGFFTSPELSQRAASGTGVLAESRMLFGVCLSSDASRFTSRAETLTATQLRDLLNRYYGLLFPLVERHGGRVSDVIGDEMLAVWDQALPAPRLREQALLAALAMEEHLHGPACRDPAAAFPTKIGLHCGSMVVGSVGAGGHFEYRAVGDVVNTATRIQSLNKQLGTRVLVSRAMVAELADFQVRELGMFRLVGRGQALEILELRGHRESIREQSRQPLPEDFAAALQAFRAGRVAQARERFAALADHHRDGASRFYRDYCDELPDTLPSDWSGIVELRRK